MVSYQVVACGKVLSTCLRAPNFDTRNLQLHMIGEHPMTASKKYDEVKHVEQKAVQQS
jgi:hypothetical protein